MNRLATRIIRADHQPASMKHPRRTPAIRDVNGDVVPFSIAEAKYMKIGGVEQWVMIRGASIQNPVLIILHGGPGFTDTPFFRSCNSDLERDFTVVYWDQRGAGKSYSRKIPRWSMRVAQFLEDLDALVDIVRTRLPGAKIVLFGHSWGSLLGCLYADIHPSKVAAYVGSGQYGDAQAADVASWTIALEEAEAHQDARALDALRRIGPPPYDADQLFAERTWLQRIEGQTSPGVMWHMMRMLVGPPEYGLEDLLNIYRGFRFSMDALYGETTRINLLKAVPELTMPVLFFLGRRDHWVPAETSLAYFDRLRAPSKKLVWFDESGHDPFVDEAAKFNASMRELVRPLVA